MSPSNSLTRAVAERLIAFESRSRNMGKGEAPPAFPVCEKLRPHLATLMGNAGFHALLSRVLAVARTEDSWLLKVEVEADGLLKLRDEAEATGNYEAAAESSTVLVSHLLGLLIAFIGGVLTLRIVREAWPDLSFID